MSSAKYVPWAPNQWETPPDGDFQPMPVRFGNRNYMLLPVSQGDGMHPQSWMPSWEPRRFDSEGLRGVQKYRYNALSKDKQRIRLVQLMNSETQSQDIYCRFLEAEYDERFQIPIRVTGDQRFGIEEKLKPEGLPWFYGELTGYTDDEIKMRKGYERDHTDDEMEQMRRDFEVSRWNDLKQRREDSGRETAQEKMHREDRDKKHIERHFDAVDHRRIQYEALSWCWGSEDPNYVVKVFEGESVFKMRVKRELALALKHLRLPDRPRTLWIDAICINQSDPDERNHQVQMMSQIYTRADQVCVWLGEGSSQSKVAIDFIRQEIMELKDFDIICSDERYSHKWQALMMLMQVPWFSRRWVVQEIALARQATIYCGNDSIPWKEFAIAIEVFTEVERASHQLSKIMQKNEQFRYVPGWFEYVSELGASLLVQATTRVFHAHENTKFADLKSEWQTRHDTRSTEKFGRRKLLSLEFLVSTMFAFKATEPRDAIYSLLSIARDVTTLGHSTIEEDEPFLATMTLFNGSTSRFPIDYSRPYSDVCRDFVRFVINRKIQLDPTQALDILCRPWALAQPRTTSKTVAQIDANNSNASLRKNPREREIWKIRKCDIVHTNVNGQDKWKLVKTENDKWEQDPRTTKQYFKEITYDKTWQSPAGAPPWQPSEGWWEYKQWCDDMRTKKNGTAGEDDLKLPSWVAQTLRAPFAIDHSHGMRFLKTVRANADPLVGPPSDGHGNYSAAQTRGLDLYTLKFRNRPGLGHHSIYVQGFELDEVMEVNDASQGGNIPVSWLELGGWKRKDGAFADDPPDELWRTLVADRGRDNRNPPYYYARACRESVHNGSVSSGRVATTELINNERNSIVAEFCRRVQSVIWNRRMFKTKNGRLGLAYDVEKGDKVCILYGCTVPVILKIHYKEVGDHDKEIDEDRKEALTACIRQCEMNYLRKVTGRKRYEEKKRRWILSGEWREMMEAKSNTEKELAKDAAEMERKAQASAEHDETDDNNDDPPSDQMIHEQLNSGNISTEDQRVEDEATVESLLATATQAGENSQNMDIGFTDFPKVSEESSDEPRDGSASQSQGDRMSREEKPESYQEKVRKAKDYDRYRWHTFQGDCYLHGMMDGEAMREKFYQELPDQVFELR